MTQKLQIARRVAGASAALAGLLFLAPAAPASAHRIEKHYTVDGRPVVSIRNAHGHIEVKSWKKPEVVVVGNHNSDKVEVDTEQAGNRIEVTTHILKENLKPADLQADYNLTVPEETELQVRTDSGMVIVERVFGDMTFDTVAADVQLREVAGYLAIKTIGGSVVCTRCIGRIEVNSISGNVSLLQPVSSSVRVQTSSGNIYFDGEFHRDGIYSLRNYSGLIEVRFSDTDSFDLTATSLQGKVENQAKLKPDPHGGRHVSSRFTTAFGTFNEGHAKVELSSFSGTIRIRRRD